MTAPKTSAANAHKTNLYSGPAADRERLRAQAVAVATRSVTVLQAHGLRDGTRVLDVGCGLGVITEAIARAHARAEVVGLDVDAAAIAEARTLADPRVIFVEGDAHALPFGAGTFDFVIHSLTMMHLPDPQRALDEAARVLAPGGTLCLVDTDDAYFLMDPPCPAFARLKELLARWYELCGGGRMRGRTLVRRLRDARLVPKRFDLEVFDSLAMGEAAFASTFLSLFRVQMPRIIAAGICSADEAEGLLAGLDAAVADGYFATIAGVCTSATKPHA